MSTNRREYIRQVIRRRITLGDPLTVRQIRKETGGSNSTIAEELRAIADEIPSLVTGTRTRSVPETMRELQIRNDELEKDKAALSAEVAALNHALKLFRNELSALMGQMAHASKQSLISLDEVRQTVIQIARAPFQAPTSPPAPATSVPSQPLPPPREMADLQRELAGVKQQLFITTETVRRLNGEKHELEEKLHAATSQRQQVKKPLSPSDDL